MIQNNIVKKIFFVLFLISFNFTTVKPDDLIHDNNHTENAKEGFASGTLVKTTTGFKKIEEISDKDRIVSCNLLPLICIADKILKKHQHIVDVVVELKINNEQLVTSPNQKFFSVDRKEWILAKDLKKNEVLLRSSGQASVDSIELKRTPTTLYTLSINNNHNFLVSDVGLFAHNMEAGSILQAIIAWFTAEKAAEAVVIGTTAYVISEQQKAEEKRKAEKRIFDQFDFGEGSNIVFKTDSKEQKLDRPNIRMDHRNIERSIASMDRIRPGNNSSITVHSREYYQKLEEDRRRNIEETNKVIQYVKDRLASDPIKTVEVKTFHKGWIWLFDYEETEIISEFISEKEYRENHKKGKQEEIAENKTIITTYNLNPESQLAKRIQREELAEQNSLKNKVNNAVDGFKKVVISVFDPSKTNQKDQTETEQRDEGAQAPGKPTSAEGYVPPKKWDGKKVKMQGGPRKGKYGWPDEQGRVWVPTGPDGHPLAHGGPHWDVAYVDGRDHKNVRPGQNINTVKKNISDSNPANCSSESHSLESLNELIKNYEESLNDQSFPKFTAEEAKEAMTDVKEILGEKRFEEVRKKAFENSDISSSDSASNNTSVRPEEEQDLKNEKLTEFTTEEAKQALSDLKEIVGEKKFEEAKSKASEDTKSEDNTRNQTFSIGVSNAGSPNNIIFSIGKSESEPKSKVDRK